MIRVCNRYLPLRSYNFNLRLNKLELQSLSLLIDKYQAALARARRVPILGGPKPPLFRHDDIVRAHDFDNLTRAIACSHPDAPRRTSLHPFFSMTVGPILPLIGVKQ